MLPADYKPYTGCEKPKIVTLDVTGQQPLKKGEVTHLALEGGGGKGLAYLGAVRALEEIGVLSNLQGFAGSSAGAITAMLLSSGMRASDVKAWMDATDFGGFFDPAEPREHILHGYPQSQYDNAMGSAVDTTWWERAFAAWLDGYALPLVARVLGDSGTQLADLISGKGKPPMSVLGPNLGKFLSQMWNDFGLFSGVKPMRTFDTLLRNLVRGYANDMPSMPPVTFDEHFQKFNRKLVVTGSNLSTGKTVYFSADTTPAMAVCVAVRISMGLPFIFKPVRIKSDQHDYDGYYVDGGVWNNTPYAPFDEGQARPTTFVLRLGIDVNEEAPEPKTLVDFLGRYFQLTFAGSGETQFGFSRAFQARELPVQGLNLIDFTPPPIGRDRAIRCAYEATMDYFGETPKQPNWPSDGYDMLPNSVPSDLDLSQVTRP